MLGKGRERWSSLWKQCSPKRKDLPGSHSKSGWAPAGVLDSWCLALGLCYSPAAAQLSSPVTRIEQPSENLSWEMDADMGEPVP